MALSYRIKSLFVMGCFDKKPGTLQLHGLNAPRVYNPDIHQNKPRENPNGTEKNDH
jgi:hypothetical protein